MSYISKQIIINNFEWIKNNQVAMDMLAIEGLRVDLIEISEQIHQLIPDDLVVKGELLELDNYKGGHLFELFSRLNSIQKNKNTYLPNLVGIYLIEHMV